MLVRAEMIFLPFHHLSEMGAMCYVFSVLVVLGGEGLIEFILLKGIMI